MQVQVCKEMDSGNPGVALDLQIPWPMRFIEAPTQIYRTQPHAVVTQADIFYTIHVGCVFQMKIVMSVRGELLDLREGC
jgi:hypothetical protein